MPKPFWHLGSPQNQSFTNSSSSTSEKGQFAAMINLRSWIFRWECFLAPVWRTGKVDWIQAFLRGGSTEGSTATPNGGVDSWFSDMSRFDEEDKAAAMTFQHHKPKDASLRQQQACFSQRSITPWITSPQPLHFPLMLVSIEASWVKQAIQGAACAQTWKEGDIKTNKKRRPFELNQLIVLFCFLPDFFVDVFWIFVLN